MYANWFLFVPYLFALLSIFAIYIVIKIAQQSGKAAFWTGVIMVFVLVSIYWAIEMFG